MKKAINQNGKRVDIIDSIAGDQYKCPVCKEILSRKFGLTNQYFAHPKGKGDNCNLKLSLVEKREGENLDGFDLDILEDEYYKKSFGNVNVELSDYKSEDGYYLTKEQKDIIFSKEDRIKISALAGCVDCDTEFFNGYGWKKISEYQEGDKVLQFTKDWNAELVLPKHYVKLQCDKMTRYKTKYGVDMVLSDEHNVVYIDTSHNKNYYWKNVNILKISEQDMKNRHIKNKTGFTGKFLTTFDYNSNNKTGMSENELRLTIAIMADGNYQDGKKSNWCRVNLKKDYKKERLQYLLRLCNIEYSINQWNSSDLQYESICFYSPLKLKHFPIEWYNLNLSERETIYDEISYWDGDLGVGNRGTRYRTSCKEDADFIQFIMASLGKRATINISKEIGKKYLSPTNNEEYVRKSVLYTVCESKNNNIISIGQQSLESNKNNVISTYATIDGYKYCFTVPSEMLVLRRNDRIFITGNSAKSSTLYYYCKERPHKKILYLVYNRAMKDEATHTFGKLSNVNIKTTHGLAYADVGRLYSSKLTFSYGVIDVIKDLNLDWKNGMELATKIHKMMNEFMLSDKECFDDLDMFKEDMIERGVVIDNCNKLWKLKCAYNSRVKVEHDFYLKLFQLKKVDLSKKYDIICLDEAQDSNLLILNLLHNSNVKGIAIVGDKFQQLYGWRKAVDIMPHFEGEEYKLTTSFRVSQNTANLANIIVKDITGIDIDMKGFNAKQTIVDKIDRNKPYACLCRTNSYIFAEVFDNVKRNSNSKLFFEGGYNSYNFQNIKDAYYFSRGLSVTNNLFSKFKNYHEMINYARETEDLELLSLDRMVENYGSRIPEVVDKIKYNTVSDKTKATVIFSTIHRSKGMTYSIPVYVSDDHFDVETSFKKAYVYDDKEFDIKKLYDEMCVLYVAITRPAGKIELSDTMKRYLLLRYDFYSEKD